MTFTHADLAALTPIQANMRAVYQALKDVGAVGATRSELVAMTRLSLWQVRVATREMVERRWVWEARQQVNHRVVCRYACHPAHWRRR